MASLAVNGLSMTLLGNSIETTIIATQCLGYTVIII